MTRLTGDLARQDIQEIIRTLFLGRATGVLEVSVDSGKRRLFFVDGELFLPPSNPLAAQLSQQLQSQEPALVIPELMARMASVIGAWREGTYNFDPGRESVPPEAVGPLPTAELVVAAAVQNRDEAGLLQRLGGEGTRWVRRAPAEGLLRNVQVDPTEMELWEKLTEPQAVGQLLQGAIDRRGVLIRLARLEALRMIERHEERARAELLVDGDLVARFGERVAQGLQARPLDLEPGQHRARLAEMLARLGDLNHYELLAVSPDSSIEQVHAAYNELGRLVHPSHAVRLGWKGREEALTLLFEKATEAYLILADPDRRKRYNRETGVIVPIKSTGDETVAQQRRSPEVAERLYQQAREMVDRTEYHYAIELLRQAVAANPKPDYYVLLAEVQQKNPNWMQHAADSLREAVHLAPQAIEYRRQLAALYDKVGDGPRARAVWRSVLSRAPGDADALRALERLGDGPKKRKGFLESLFGGG